MKVTNVLSAGCSFTANEVVGFTGGTPPGEESLGSNSFRQNLEPKSWAGWLAKKLDSESFVNVAAGACGNYCVSKSVRTMLEKYNYAPTNTLVIFNITSMSRRDVKVKYNSLNKYIPWEEDLMDFTFLEPFSSEWKAALKDIPIYPGIGKPLIPREFIEEIVERNTRKLYQLFEYLTENAYPYVFTTMEDYSHLPLVQEYKDNLVPLPGNGMFEFATSLCEISEDKFHPTINAHHRIGHLAYNFICKKGYIK
jgi:hypothetical protein|tara:strand:- start:13 stop:768 length:756 start_codon:yes stop_codon:yes gene_type:complete